jgi:hypothetical protein
MYPSERSTKPAALTSTKPQQVAGKQRQRFTTINGLVLERSYISMKPSVWEMLTEMSRIQSRSHSEILESLVQFASTIGNKKADNGNEAI